MTKPNPEYRKRDEALLQALAMRDAGMNRTEIAKVLGGTPLSWERQMYRVTLAEAEHGV